MGCVAGGKGSLFGLLASERACVVHACGGTCLHLHEPSLSAVHLLMCLTCILPALCLGCCCCLLTKHREPWGGRDRDDRGPPHLPPHRDHHPHHSHPEDREGRRGGMPPLLDRFIGSLPAPQYLDGPLPDLNLVVDALMEVCSRFLLAWQQQQQQRRQQQMQQQQQRPNLV